MRKIFTKIAGALIVAILSISTINAQTGAYYTGVYRNLFKEHLSKTDAETQTKINGIWTHFFENSTNKVYTEVGTDMGYILDTGNDDVRTEGMSYGMMICVQLNKQAQFDRIWRWSKKYMQYQSGNWDGYFAWQCKKDGTKIGGESTSCASDGEAYFITALFFAANRWGNTTGIDYEAEAQLILKKVMNKTGVGGVYNLFNTDSKLITFVPSGDSYKHSDPSYNLPAFFQLWADWSTTNKAFWAQTPAAARTHLKNASHVKTGLFPDYSSFDGSPFNPSWKTDYDAKRYQYDAIRCAMNVGMDYHWFGTDAANQTASMTRLLTFFQDQKFAAGQYNVDGTGAAGSYSEGMAGANGVGAFAVTNATLAKTYVERLWNTNPPSGQWRYYNGMVYFLSMLNASGNFKIYKPKTDAFIATVTAGPISASPATIQLTATAADPAGTIAKVQFYNGTKLLGEATTSPYSFSWTGVAAGTYTITAVATNNTGKTATSEPLEITVSAPPVDGTITFRAIGIAGTESVNLEIDGKIVKTWTLTTEYADYTATGNINGKIRVNYTNDATGLDAQIDYLIAGTKTYQAEDQAINTGYYANGACGGGSNSELMHCSGYIEFSTGTDIVDGCPNDPNKTEPGLCGCGVAEGTCTPASDVIALTAGWNLIGCPITGTTPLKGALSSIWAQVESVKDLDTYYHIDNPAVMNTLINVEWGKGYLVKVKADCKLDWIVR